MNDAQEQYLTGLNDDDQKKLLAEIKRMIITPAQEAEITFPNGAKKTLKRVQVTEIWKFITELRDGQEQALYAKAEKIFGGRYVD